MVTANVLRSVRTVESGPLLVDASTAAALCGKYLRTWRVAGRWSDPEADPHWSLSDSEIQRT
jgi:hypothetical protein